MEVIFLKANMDIRSAAKQRGVFLWQIADALQIQESRFSKNLRTELPEAEKQRILAVIDNLAKGED